MTNEEIQDHFNKQLYERVNVMANTVINSDEDIMGVSLRLIRYKGEVVICPFVEISKNEVELLMVAATSSDKGVKVE